MKFYHLIGLSYLLWGFEWLLLQIIDFPNSYPVRLAFVFIQGSLLCIYILLYLSYLIARKIQKKRRLKRVAAPLARRHFSA